MYSSTTDLHKCTAVQLTYIIVQQYIWPILLYSSTTDLH